MIDTIWLSNAETKLPVELWHHVVSFTVEKPKLKDYIIIDDQVIHVTPSSTLVISIRRFKQKNLLPKMHRKTFGNKLQDSFITFDLLEGRKTIQEVLAL
jgi:hypothetical protein